MASPQETQSPLKVQRNYQLAAAHLSSSYKRVFSEFLLKAELEEYKERISKKPQTTCKISKQKKSNVKASAVDANTETH